MSKTTFPIEKPPGRREQRREEMRDRIAAAGLRVFAKRGYRVCTVEDLLVQAGVSRATFYQHFSGKAELAQVILDGMWSNATGVYAAFAALETLNFTSVRQWLGQVDRQWSAGSEDLATILRELPFEISRTLGERREEVISALIGDSRHWQAISADEARQRAALLIFQLERTMQELHLQGWRDDRGAVLDSLSRLWLKALEP